MKFRTNPAISNKYDPALNIDIKQQINESSMMLYGKPFDFPKEESVPDINEQFHKVYDKETGTVFVPIDSLIINQQAQRFRTNCLQNKNVKEIIYKFNVNLFAPIDVCKFEEKLICTDGQGRLIGLIAGHPAVTHVPVTIKNAFSWEDVIKSYRSNHDSKVVTKISAYDDFNTACACGDDYCKKLKSIFLKGLTEQGKKAKKGAKMVFIDSEGNDLVQSFKGDYQKAEEVAEATNRFKRLYWDGQVTNRLPQNLFALQTQLENYCEWSRQKGQLHIQELVNPNMIPISDKQRLASGLYERLFFEKEDKKVSQSVNMISRCTGLVKLVVSNYKLGDNNAVPTGNWMKCVKGKKTNLDVFFSYLQNQCELAIKWNAKVLAANTENCRDMI